MMRYAYFPGCSLESTAWDFDRSTRALCAALGVELTEIAGWVCCGSTPAHSQNASLATALPAVNLQIAQSMHAPVVTACASCYSRLRVANHEIRNSLTKRRQIEQITNAPYDGSVEVIHLLDLLTNHVGQKAIAQKIKRPLTGLKVASYYGCLLSRPPSISAFESADQPVSMDRLLEAAGAIPVQWPYKTECCGASLSLTDPAITSRLGKKLLEMARTAGADCVSVACPLCQSNLDLRQSDALAAGAGETIPVLYVTQLLGLALGLTPEALGLDALSINADKVIKCQQDASLAQGPLSP
jgi:heterodisulfide reductase subunit B2